jgi:hypothetical protein
LIGLVGEQVSCLYSCVGLFAAFAYYRPCSFFRGAKQIPGAYVFLKGAVIDGAFIHAHPQLSWLKITTLRLTKPPRRFQRQGTYWGGWA